MDLTRPKQVSCIDCGAAIQQPIRKGRRRERCEACVKVRAQHHAAKWRALNVADGKCADCGKDKEDAGLRCRTCAKKHVAAVLKLHARHRAEGRCRCGGVPQEGYACCPKCLQYLRRRREENKAAKAASVGTTESL